MYPKAKTRASLAAFVTFVTFLLGECSFPAQQFRKQVFADVTSNKFSREHDGTWGLWSFQGVAQESHASKTSFIFNADLISADSRHNVASTVYPALGLTSDLDPIYQEYLILQAKVLGIDGFLIEWGYEGHTSDRALQSYIQLARKHPDFKITVNWCDHWLMEKMKNKTKKEIVATFHRNLQYLLDTLYAHGPEVTPFIDSHPVIFLFGGGIDPHTFKEVLLRPLKLPASVERPVWIGSYLNFVAPSPSASWTEWKDLINGTFGWAPYIRKPMPPELKEWDYYGDLSDVISYQKNLSSFGEDCMGEGACQLWCGSASPRFDNRGCAGWGRELRLIPEKDLETHARFTYDAQWDYHIRSNITDCIVIPTINDFPEATPLLDDSSNSLYSTFKHIHKWRGTGPRDESIVPLPMEWYRLYKDVQFYLMTPGLNESFLYAYLHAASEAMDKHGYEEAADFLKMGRTKLEILISGLRRRNISLTVPGDAVHPCIPPFPVEGPYLINRTTGLYLTVEDGIAKSLTSSNYKGFLHFQLYSLNASINSLKVFSPTKRKRPQEDTVYLSRSQYSSSNTEHMGSSKVSGNFAEVCSLVTNSSGSWEDVTVELFRKNQAWDHSGPYKSDLHFESDGMYLVRNISLDFHLVKLDNISHIT